MVSNPDQIQVVEGTEILGISHEHLLAADDSFGQAAFICDPEGRVLMLNQTAIRLERELDFRDTLTNLGRPNGVKRLKGQGDLYKYKIKWTTIDEGYIYGRIGMDLLNYTIQTLLHIQHRIGGQLQMITGVLQLIVGKIEDKDGIIEGALTKARLVVVAIKKMVNALGPIEECRITAIPLGQILYSIANEIRSLSVDVDIDGSLLVDANVDLVKVVILNLIENAKIHAGEDVNIHVSSSVSGDEVVIFVQDDGCGISPDRLEYIFYPFTSRTQVGECLGIGLYIARRIIYAMGGRIWVESEVGRGSTFSFSLPLATELPEFTDYCDDPVAVPSKV